MRNEVCNGGKKYRNTASRSQCYEKNAKTIALVDKGFKFASVAIARELINYNKEKRLKNIVPLQDIHGIEDNIVEASYQERIRDKQKTKSAIDGVSYTFHLSTNGHKAIESYDDTKDFDVFIFTEDDKLICVEDKDGKVGGIPIRSFSVGSRIQAKPDSVPSTKVDIQFKKHDPSIISLNFYSDDLEGVYDLDLEVVSATSTTIEFKATSFGKDVTGLSSDNIVLKDDSMATLSFSLVTFDADTKTYKITGTGFANGYTLDLDGVQEAGLITYESVEKQVLKDIA